MSTQSTHKKNKESALESFNLAFEYDMTWHAVKKQTKQRTL